jgi:hypothetical protein
MLQRQFLQEPHDVTSQKTAFFETKYCFDEIRWDSPLSSLILLIYNLISPVHIFGHVFPGQRGTKRPGPTATDPPKKRKCSICKQEGNSVVFS